MSKKVGGVYEAYLEEKVQNPSRPVVATSERLGVSQRTVRRHVAAREGTNPPHRRYTPEEEARALELLRAGAGYRETARTLGREEHRLAKKFPGYALSREETGQRSAIMRKGRRLGV